MIKFGPSGNSLAFSLAGNKKSEQSAAWVKALDLDCFEYSFGRGVNLTDSRALEIGGAFKAAGVEISVHAPYYINLANPSDLLAENSYNYIIDSAKKCILLGGDRVVFHPASQGKLDRDHAVSLTVERLKILRDKVYALGLEKVKFCPETMGKLAQIGTVEEVVEFCKVDKIYTPAVDFGHINARTQGSLRSTSDYENIINYMVDNLGLDRVKNFHVHFSKIEYTAKGEVRHLTFEDTVYGPMPEHFLEAVIKTGVAPYIVCESAGTQDKDALTMKTVYNNMLTK